MVSESASADELLQLARDLVARSPQQALAWAESQEDSRLRECLMFAVVQAWGEADPRAAIDWVSGQNPEDQMRYLEKAFAGAVKQPELALEIGRDLLGQESGFGKNCAVALIGALGKIREFQTALQFAGELPSDLRRDCVSPIFFNWGVTDPASAVKALDSIEDKSLRTGAFEQLVSGWASANSPALAAYAVTLPAGDERSAALGKAFENWSLQDPATMGEWLNALPPSPEFDRAIASMLAKTDSMNRSPEVAMSWVAGMSDPQLRRDSLLNVAKQWAQTDLAAARKYVSGVAWLTPAQREEVLRSLQPNTKIAYED